MPYAITQLCCTDASCVTACPVNCIHPTPDEPDFGTTDMLYVDPRTCIDCGACAEVCPVDAVFPAETLTGALADYPAVNAEYFAGTEPAAPPAGSPLFHAWGPVRFDRVLPADFPDLDVAVVGSGPAGMYTVQDLLLHTTARVTLYDRLPVAGGLVRFGVAPDHPDTKRIGESFARYHDHHRLRLRLDTEVGRDIGVEELGHRHDAVVYAVGAPTARDLGIPGERLPGHLPSTTVVGWYNGHPEIAAHAVPVDAEDAARVAVVGTGNVALDIARILTADPDRLAGTAIHTAALGRLRASRVREVVLLGRRGPEHAAYTRGELTALLHREDLEVVVDDRDPRVGRAIDTAAPGDHAALLRDVPRCRPEDTPPAAGRRRVVLRFHATPRALLGDGHVSGVRVDGPDGPDELPAGLVVRAIGHRGRPLTGLPFDDETGTVPHDAGRVEGRPGTYVVGWIKRGPGGGIGTNRRDAAETVASLIEDGKNRVIGPRPRRGGVLRRAAHRGSSRAT
ncbi:FAD-dependent oxidoreductase [Actinomycetospora cinnamomea]|uniref:ferredoxin--NADP(+) reductase n=1 Tax=Actinomycetospora cinnamomea TaxID=663609 RepID=A0A2U1EAC2_9PSEU|nr:FAD-dependent oxidoreductase [Actinomycetospora cinnamomea]PVY96904.1 ferredoxin--NADP+ reductase [Actinomycetospora cinnamomea]